MVYFFAGGFKKYTATLLLAAAFSVVHAEPQEASFQDQCALVGLMAQTAMGERLSGTGIGQAVEKNERTLYGCCQKRLQPLLHSRINRTRGARNLPPPAIGFERRPQIRLRHLRPRYGQGGISALYESPDRQNRIKQVV